MSLDASQAGSRHRSRRWLRALTSLPARLAITVALLSILALTIDWSAFADRIEDGNWGWFAAGVAMLAVGLVAGARRWLELLWASGVETTWRAAFRAFMVGTFANNFLPTGFGGDAVRTVAVAQGRTALARATTAVVADRVTAFACLIVLAWITLPLGADAVPGSLVVALALVSLAGLIALLVGRWALGSGRLGRMVPARLRPIAIEMRRPLATFASDRRLAVRVTGLGLVYQALLVAAVWSAARSVGLELSYALLAVSVALVLPMTVLPISIAGFGVREGGFALVLGEAAVSAADATLISLIGVVMLAVASLPGAVALAGGWRAPTAA
jgi:uncharacterized membrane protein YbhN (UPF0104 family)